MADRSTVQLILDVFRSKEEIEESIKEDEERQASSAENSAEQMSDGR